MGRDAGAVLHGRCEGTTCLGAVEHGIARKQGKLVARGARFLGRSGIEGTFLGRGVELITDLLPTTATLLKSLNAWMKFPLI